MADLNSLKESIAQYEGQLSQVQVALSATPKGSKKDNLLVLQSDLLEVIKLTKESLESLEGLKNSNDKSALNNQDGDEDPLAREYALFKAELENSGDSKNDQIDEAIAGATSDIDDKLEDLEGMRCRAPYGSSWGGVGYHNAMIGSVHREEKEGDPNLNDIKVQVLFLNPTHKEMIPCPYFLGGECKFTAEQCHYSHGEIVPVSSLQEYRKPDFSSIRMGSRVLAKQENQLWHRCVVLQVPEKNQPYRVKFESSGTILEVPIQDLLPLDDSDLQMSDSSGSEEEIDLPSTEIDRETLIQTSLLTMDSCQPLGKWEEHTRGIGSKIMAQMGYITGTGLGKRADGRVAPVEATVLPPGKSLDHCMELRAKAGGDKNLFSTERKMRKQKLKIEEQSKKQYDKEQQQSRINVFDFINETLSSQPEAEEGPSCSKHNSQILESRSKMKSMSDKELNVSSYKIGNNISSLEKESNVLIKSLNRHEKYSPAYNNIVQRFNDKQKEIVKLKTSERHIASEQRDRKNRKKLTVF